MPVWTRPLNPDSSNAQRVGRLVRIASLRGEQVAGCPSHYEARAEGAMERHVFFLPPGENRWLLTVDRYLGAQRAAATCPGGSDFAHD